MDLHTPPTPASDALQILPLQPRMQTLETQVHALLEELTYRPPATLRSAETQERVLAIEMASLSLAQEICLTYGGVAPDIFGPLRITAEHYDAVNDAETTVPPEVVRIVIDGGRTLTGDAPARTPAVILLPTIGDPRYDSKPGLSLRFEMDDLGYLAAFSDGVVRNPDVVDELCSLGGLHPLVAESAPSGNERRALSAHIEAFNQDVVQPTLRGERFSPNGGLVLVAESTRDVWSAGLAAMALYDFSCQWVARRPRPERRLRAVTALLAARHSIRNHHRPTVTAVDFRSGRGPAPEPRLG